jgi:dihydroflavonol-4-reductase
MKYNNIFITGSTGVVGKPLLRKIVNQGHNVFALSRSKNNDRLFSDLGITKIEGDLFSESNYDNLSDKNIDAIFHIAGVNKMCSKNPDGMFKTNIDGTKQMLELGNRLKIKKFIYTSSAVTLGEELGTVGNELSQHRGYFLSKYEESKFLAEEEAFDYDKDFEFVSVNPSSVQGPGRVSGTAKLLISTLNKQYPPLIKNNISIVDDV